MPHGSKLEYHVVVTNHFLEDVGNFSSVRGSVEVQQILAEVTSIANLLAANAWNRQAPPKRSQRDKGALEHRLSDGSVFTYSIEPGRIYALRRLYWK